MVLLVCAERKADPFHAPLDLILNFLVGKKAEGLAYNTVAGYKSAISAYHAGINGAPIGQHQLVKRLLTGVYNECPPKPKYTGTWDVQQVLNYIEELGPNNELDDGTLTHKLAMLLAITTAGRASDLLAFDLGYMADQGESINFALVELTKTSKPGKQRQVVSIHEFTERPALYSVECVRDYIRRTISWRTTDKQHKLFLGIIAPHKPVVSCTISNWLKKIMQGAGIHVSRYQGHSTRSAATSRAKVAGLSVAEIVDRANWSNAGTFKKFYNRENNIDQKKSNEAFTNSVLSA